MFRRDFIQRLTVGGIGGAAVTGAIRANDLKTITYRVKGFTCVTCAVGLETMLQREKGITSVKASYPKATVIIRFDPELIAENSLKEFIAEMGFSVEGYGATEPSGSIGVAMFENPTGRVVGISSWVAPSFDAPRYKSSASTGYQLRRFGSPKPATSNGSIIRKISSVSSFRIERASRRL